MLFTERGRYSSSKRRRPLFLGFYESAAAVFRRHGINAERVAYQPKRGSKARKKKKNHAPPKFRWMGAARYARYQRLLSLGYRADDARRCK